MAKQYFKINGVPIKTPSSFKLGRYSITKSNRVMNGDMHMDLIARKEKFYMTYEVIRESELKVILDQIWYNGTRVFFTLEYLYNNIPKSARVYVGEINQELALSGEVDWVWKNLTFNFIEQ